VSYNPHPTIANCYKHSVALSYDSPASSPLSISMVGSKVLARFHKLTGVDVSSKEDCTSASVRLRRYQLSYGVDADTKLPRLQSVQMLGREGTPEASTPLPIAGYNYAAATNGGALVYRAGQAFGLDSAGRSSSDPQADPVFGSRSLIDRMLLDITGDGRPDFLSFTPGGAMTVRRNISRVDTVSFGNPATFSDDVMSPRALDVRTTKQQISGATRHDYSMVWREMIDVNGDGRVDMIDTIENPGNWQVYLNSPDPSDPREVRWEKRIYPIAPLVQYLRARGYTVDSNFLPLSRRISLGESLRITCWAFNGVDWVQLSEEEANQLPSVCHGFTAPLRGMQMTDWELKDINGDGYPDLVFSSSPILPKWRIVSDERETASNGFATLVEIQGLEPKAGNNNKIEAVFNVLGTRLADGATPYSAPVTLRTNEPCGVAQSISDSFSSPTKAQCGLVDVNGDGIVDRVSYAASYADVGRRLLTQVTVSSPSGSRAFTYQGFDPVGRERSRVEVKNGATTGATTNWTYDALGRLASALTTSGATTTLNQQLTYDPLGNLQTLSNLAGGGGTTSTALTYLDTDRDRICRIKHGSDAGTACNVTYDEVGSILTQATPTGQRQYSYLIDGSVRTISDSQGSTAHFRYDAFGAVQELDLTTPVSQDGRRDRHYGGLISERVENGARILLRKIPGPDGFLATRHGPAGRRSPAPC
jgi:YD repeat-containing protein